MNSATTVYKLVWFVCHKQQEGWSINGWQLLHEWNGLP